MFDRNLRRGEANVIGVYALGFVLGGLSVFIGCGDPSADDDADVGDDVVSDVDVLQDVDVPMDVDDDAGEADADTVGETETAAVCGNGVLEDGEECDDANDVSGDGCEPDTCVFSCHEDDDCLEIPEDDPCTVNSCEGVTGGQACRSAPNEGASCDDGDSCTEDDRCDDAGICRAGTNVCHCPGGTTEECAAHEDGNLCNGTLVCNPETRLCEVNPETVVTCPADEPCRTHPCDPETGGCLLIDRAEGHSCTPDAFACTDDVCDGGGTCIHRITDGWCLIGGDCHENGETEPWNPCRSCDVSTTRTAWTNRPVGYSCDDGLFCSGTETCNASGACVSTGDPCPESCRACNEGTGACDVVEATCWIAGACWTDGAVRPGYPCQVCESTTSRTAWSNRPDGSSCDDGLWCNGSDACDAAGACVAGTTDRCPETCRTCNEGTDGCDLVAGFCWVDGACWADGVSRPWNLCQFCDAAGNPGTWTHRPVGYSCDDGLFCTGPDACSDAGTCLSAGDPCPESCRTCNEALDRCDVATGCWIEGACYAEGAVRPGYPCQYCSGSSSRTSWTSRAVGYSCDDGLFCNGVDTCNASGACVSAGDPCPEACRTCNEGTGACDVTTGCWISGACWADGAQRPGNPCQYCDAGAGRTAWTGRPTGYSCDDGVFCNGAETCSAEHVCTPGTPVPDLTECRTAADEAGVCRSAVCVAIECGNALVDPGEACDDGGTDACDGCSPSCRWSYSLEPGVGGYARVADSPSIAALTGAHTIEAWVWIPSTLLPMPPSGAFISIIQIPRSTDGDGFKIRAFGEGGRNVVGAAFNDGASYCTIRAPVAPGWRHVAAQMSAGGILSFFIDGRVPLEALSAGSCSGPRTPRHEGVYIGNDGYRVAPSYPEPIDSVRISTGARYTAPFAPSLVLAADAATVMLLTFDEGGGPALDASGNGNSAVLVGAATRGVRVPDAGDSAIRFEAGGRGRAPASASFDALTSQVTMEAWVDFPATLLPVGDHGLLAMPRSATGAGLEMWIRREGSANALFASIFQGTTCRCDCTVVGIPVAGGWRHVAYVWTTTAVDLYVDGSRACSAPCACPTPPHPQGFYFAQEGVPSGTPTFPNAMDEIRISSVARYAGPFTPTRRLPVDASTVAMYRLDDPPASPATDSSPNGNHAALTSHAYVPRPGCP